MILYVVTAKNAEYIKREAILLMIFIKLKRWFYFYSKNRRAVKKIFKGGSQPCMNNNPTTSITSLFIIIGTVLILSNYKLALFKITYDLMY